MKRLKTYKIFEYFEEIEQTSREEGLENFEKIYNYIENLYNHCDLFRNTYMKYNIKILDENNRVKKLNEIINELNDNEKIIIVDIYNKFYMDYKDKLKYIPDLNVIDEYFLPISDLYIDIKKIIHVYDNPYLEYKFKLFQKHADDPNYPSFEIDFEGFSKFIFEINESLHMLENSEDIIVENRYWTGSLELSIRMKNKILFNNPYLPYPSH